MITVKAPAKINLMLRITGRQSDGYHLLGSVIQTISLYDHLHFYPMPPGRIELQLHGTNNSLTAGEDNLIMRAARLVEKEARTRHQPLGGCRIHLEKHIPIGAGLGGGSSDAAGTLIALNRLWNLDWPRELLLQLAARLGADVPYFLEGGTAWVEGIGDQVRKMPDLPSQPLILAVPPLVVSTPEVYHAYDRDPDRPLIDLETARQEARRLWTAFHNQDWLQAAALAHNDLQAPAIELFPQLGITAQGLAESSCRWFAMTGSGGAFFAFGCPQKVPNLEQHAIYSLHTISEGVQIVKREDFGA